MIIMANSSKVHKQGFTMVELLVAISIFSIVAVYFFQVYVQTMFLAENTKNSFFALSEAHTKLEEIRNSTYESISSTYNNTSFSLTQPTGGSGAISVSSIGSQVAGNLLQIQITVTWQNKNQRSVSAAVTSYIAKK